MNTELLEIFQNPILNINPAFVHGIRHSFQENVNGRIPVAFHKRPGVFLPISQSRDFLEKIYATSDPEGLVSWGDLDETEDAFINIVNVLGPITRGGGACSYGSKEMRDQVIFAASQPNCIAHIFYADSPGGSAFSKNDFAQAIDAIHASGLDADMVVDGFCYSACQALAALCDHVYYTHPEDGFGCIGSMAAFYTQADGSKNEYTDETYHELYDPESFDKNAEFRALANDDDDSLIIEELRKDGEKFRSLVKEHCPNVTDEMLHGKTYKAYEVEGILNNGQRSLDEMIQIIADEYTASHPAPVQGSASATTNSATVIRNSATVPGESSPAHNANSKTIINNSIMNTPFINAAIGAELVVKEGGSFFVEAMLQQIEEALKTGGEAQNALVSATETINTQLAQIKELNDKITLLTQEKQAANDLVASLTSERDNLAQEKNTLTTQLTEANNKLTEQTTANETAVNDLQAQLTEANNTIAERDATIADLNARGTQSPTPSPQESNNPPAQKPTTANVWDPTKSPEENRQAFEARMKALG